MPAWGTQEDERQGEGGSGSGNDAQLLKEFLLPVGRQASDVIEQQVGVPLGWGTKGVLEGQLRHPGMTALGVQALAVEFHVGTGSLFPRTDAAFVVAGCAVDPHRSLPGNLMPSLCRHFGRRSSIYCVFNQYFRLLREALSS